MATKKRYLIINNGNKQWADLGVNLVVFFFHDTRTMIRILYLLDVSVRCAG